MFVADNADAFRHLFITSLRNMLSPDQAGAFILVLANSMQDDELRNDLVHDLAAGFKAVQKEIQHENLEITADDLAVFKAIEDIGIKSLSCWQSCNAGAWELVYNPVRALRPARESNRIVDQINQPFDEKKFNFNKPFLKPEILWQGSWQDTHMRVLYNKFPFVPFHLIIVPDPSLQLPQYLTAEYHGLMWDLIAQQHGVIPGFGAGYNSMGACASVNQLHFQGFVRNESLPIEQLGWQHKGGSELYPMNCHAFSSAQDSWALIDEYHKNNQPYNLLYRCDRCYVIPRMMQGSEGVLPRVHGAGWIEECGVFNVSDSSELQSISEQKLTDCLRSLSVPSS